MTVQDQTPSKQEFSAPLAGTPMAREQAMKFLGLIIFAVLAWIAITIFVWLGRRNLWAVSHITGYVLFVVVLGLVWNKGTRRRNKAAPTAAALRTKVECVQYFRPGLGKYILILSAG